MKTYKKVLSFSLLFLFVVLGTNHVFASIQLSNPYSNLSLCNTDVSKYNEEYPSFVRSDCFIGENDKYYYNICEAGTTCGIEQGSETNSIEDENAINVHYELYEVKIHMHNILIVQY